MFLRLMNRCRAWPGPKWRFLSQLFAGHAGLILPFGDTNLNDVKHRFLHQ